MGNDDEPVSETGRINFIMGQLAGVEAILLTLIKTHPDPGRLYAEIQLVEQHLLATAEAASPSDLYIEGMRGTIDRLQNYTARRAQDTGETR